MPTIKKGDLQNRISSRVSGRLMSWADEREGWHTLKVGALDADYKQRASDRQSERQRGPGQRRNVDRQR